jgi:mRNA interferase MazF
MNGHQQQTTKPMASSDVKPGDIVVVPFPYTDKLAEKRRPALVISAPTLTHNHDLLWVTMITSAKNAKRADDIPLPLAGSGLEAPSFIRPTKIATMEVSRVLRVAGKVDAETMETVKQVVRSYLH